MTTLYSYELDGPYEYGYNVSFSYSCTGVRYLHTVLLPEGMDCDARPSNITTQNCTQKFCFIPSSILFDYTGISI